MNRLSLSYTIIGLLLVKMVAPLFAADSLQKQISETPNKLICEGYTSNNWELFIMDADGGNQRNLTNTSNIHELYPQVSPDGLKIAFVSDTGKGRKKIRSVWVMNVDGSERIKVSDYARQPFWAADSKTLGYLPQEYKKFSALDFSTKGMMFHDLASGKSTPHVNSEQLKHLYNPGMSPDGKWIVATVHGGMGFKHADILIEAKGKRIINLKVHGCRPSFSPDGKHIAWGSSDHVISILDIDLTSNPPTIGKPYEAMKDKKNKIYHSEWSPKGDFLTISRGPDGKGDPGKPGTCQAAAEIVGVYAAGWNLFAVGIKSGKTIDLNQPANDQWKQLTHDGQSYKEPSWVPVAR